MRGAINVDLPSVEFFIPTSLNCIISHFDSYLYSCAANVQSTGGWATHSHSELQIMLVQLDFTDLER